jgi:predicted ATP-binding protein involved in virulence
MRIKQISVYGLFDLFDHEIVLNEKERITIIHGPNGFGKTCLLRMIDGFFNGDFTVFKETPFHKLSAWLDDGRQISVEKTKQSKVQIFSYDGIKKKDITSKKVSMQPEYVGSGGFLDTENKERRRSWLVEHSLDLPVRLVRTQRLEAYDEDEDEDEDEISFGHRSKMILTVSKYSKELAKKIQEALRKYAASAEELDRTFPMRLLQYKLDEATKADTLTKKLEALEEKRTRLTALGFLDPEKNSGSLTAKDIEKKLDVFSVYVEDTEKKLQVFDEMADKISLLMEIIEKRFLYKKLSIHRDRGFEFTTKNGKPLELAKLSSGEQQELVLLYEMLFQVPADSLLLIDEPEISLHVAWQINFLSDLERIVKLAGFDLILATHSPQIINDRWDLTVELKGPLS